MKFLFCLISKVSTSIITMSKRKRNMVVVMNLGSIPIRAKERIVIIIANQTTVVSFVVDLLCCPHDKHLTRFQIRLIALNVTFYGHRNYTFYFAYTSSPLKIPNYTISRLQDHFMFFQKVISSLFLTFNFKVKATIMNM